MVEVRSKMSDVLYDWMRVNILFFHFEYRCSLLFQERGGDEAKITQAEQ